MSGSIQPTTTRTTGAAQSSAAGSTAAASTPAARLGADMTTFLKLLTTQMQNQDPTSPMDADQLTQQLVQFSTVEQQVNTNQTLAQLLSLQQAGQLGEAAALTGRRVTVETDRLPLQAARAEVNLPTTGSAQSARIEVRDGAGLLVRTAEVPFNGVGLSGRSDITLSGGVATWRWDGRDSTGAVRRDGVYRVTVGGRGSDGGSVPLAHTVTAEVTGATRENGAVMLRMGGLTVGYDKLRDLATRS